MFKLNFKLKKINPLAGIAGRELVGIELGAGDMKLVYVRGFGERRDVVGAISRKTAGLSDQDAAKALNLAFHGLKSKNPEVAYVISSNLVITKNIEVPSTDPREIREIINLQAGRHTPYSREEIVVDYIDIGTFKRSYTKILLVIVARSAIKKHFDMIEKAGLKPAKALLSVEGLGHCAARLLNADTMKAPACIVHVDEAATDFTVVSKNRVVYLRSVPVGAEQLAADREKNEQRFTEELRRSMEAYQSENIEIGPDIVILTGSTEELPGIERVLTETLRLPVRSVPYMNNIIASDEVRKAISSLKRASFLGIIAPLFAWDDLRVNLIPEEVKLRKVLEERGKELIKTGILILTAFIVLCVIFISKIYFKTVYLKNVSTKFQALDVDAQKLESSFAKVSLVRNYMAKRGLSLEVLAELYRTIPMEVELGNIRYEESGKMNMRGTAETMSAVFSFVNSLQKSKYFKDVKTKYTSKRKEGSKDVTDFEILAMIQKGVSSAAT